MWQKLNAEDSSSYLLKMFSEAAYFSNFSTADKPSSGAAPQL